MDKGIFERIEGVVLADEVSEWYCFLVKRING